MKFLSQLIFGLLLVSALVSAQDEPEAPADSGSAPSSNNANTNSNAISIGK